MGRRIRVYNMDSDQIIQTDLRNYSLADPELRLYCIDRDLRPRDSDKLIPVNKPVILSRASQQTGLPLENQVSISAAVWYTVFRAQEIEISS